MQASTHSEGDVCGTSARASLWTRSVRGLFLALYPLFIFLAAACTDSGGTANSTQVEPVEQGPIRWNTEVLARIPQPPAAELGLSEEDLAPPADGSGVRRIEDRSGPVGRIPELSTRELPPRTRAPLDPARESYLREPVHVSVEESMVDLEGEEIPIRVPILENYLKQYLRRAGFPVDGPPEKARFHVRGRLDSAFHTTMQFKTTTVSYRVRGVAYIALSEPDGKELERFEVPETFADSVEDEASAFTELRRYAAKLLWELLFREGTHVGNPDIQMLIDLLAVGPMVGAEDATTETILEQLVAHGFEAVPYLIEAVADTRAVRMPTSHPGVDERTPNALKIYHVADKALEEIFQKVSRMTLETPTDHRVVVLKGWENEWRRFCAPFRNAP